MVEKKARVKIEVEGGAKAKSEVKGVADEAVRQSRRVAQEAERNARQATNAVTRAAREQIRAQREASREATRLARQEATATRQLRRDRMAALGGAALGLGAYGLAQARSVGGAVGIRTREENVRHAMDFGVGLSRLSIQAGRSREGREQLRSQILGTSQRTGVDTGELLSGLSRGQEKFSDLAFFAENLEMIGRVSRFTNTNVIDVVDSLGEYRRQMQVSASEVPELVGMLMQASRDGSVEFRDIATQYATSIGMFKRITGVGGMEGARQLTAIQQVVARSGGTQAENATRVERTMAEMLEMMGAGPHRAERRRLMEQKVGGRVWSDDGHIVMPLRDVFTRLAGSNISPRDLQTIFPDVRSGVGAGTIVQQIQQDLAAGKQNPMDMLAGASSSAGLAMLDQFDAFNRGDPAAEAARAANDANVMALRNSDALLAFARDVAGPLAKLQNEFPRLSMAVEALTAALVGGAVIGALTGRAGVVGTVASSVSGMSLGNAAARAASATGTAGRVAGVLGPAGVVGALAARLMPDQSSPEIMAARRAQREAAGEADPAGPNGIFVGQSSGAVNRQAVRELARELGHAIREQPLQATIVTPPGSGQSRLQPGGPARR